MKRLSAILLAAAFSFGSAGLGAQTPDGAPGKGSAAADTPKAAKATKASKPAKKTKKAAKKTKKAAASKK